MAHHTPEEQHVTYSFAIIGSRGYPSTYGGFETLVRRLAPYLADNGDRVTVYCRGGRPGELLKDGVRCVTTRGLDSKTLSTLSYGLTSAVHARRQNYDAVLVLNIANGFFLPMLGRAGIPTAVNVDGIEWQRDKWSHAGKAVFRHAALLTARHASQIIVDSREIGRIWQSQLHRSGTFIPYGADIVRDIGSTRIRKMGIKPHSYALVVARLVPENNIDLFLDALDHIEPELPAIVVGSANTPDALTGRLRARDVSHRDFHWLGHVVDQELLSELWAHCAVYYHGHSVGGTNPALLQALGHGAPTIAVDTPFNAEVIDHRAQLCPPSSPELAAALNRVVNDHTRQRRFSEHGYEVVGKRYTWPAVLKSYRDALLGLRQ